MRVLSSTLKLDIIMSLVFNSSVQYLISQFLKTDAVKITLLLWRSNRPNIRF